MLNENYEDLAVLGEESLPHLYRSESGEFLILTRDMKIAVHSPTEGVLDCYCLRRRIFLQLKKMSLILRYRVTDDRMYHFRIKRENLHHILSMGAFKRRPNAKGRFINYMRKRFGHEIRPFRMSAIEFRERFGYASKPFMPKPANSIKGEAA